MTAANPGGCNGCNGFHERDADPARPARTGATSPSKTAASLRGHRSRRRIREASIDLDGRTSPGVRRPARPRRRRGRLHGRHRGGVPHRLPLPRPPRHDAASRRPAPSREWTSTCASSSCAANCTATCPAGRGSSAPTSTARTSPARPAAATRIRTSSRRTAENAEAFTKLAATDAARRHRRPGDRERRVAGAHVLRPRRAVQRRPLPRDVRAGRGRGGWGVRHVDHLFCAMSDRARLRQTQTYPMRAA